MKFEPIDSFEITTRGTVFTGPVGEDIPDYREYIGKTITIRDKKYIIKGFEHFGGRQHKFTTGENIGILVKEVVDERN